MTEAPGRNATAREKTIVKHSMQALMRQALNHGQEEAIEAAAELQRTDQLTVVLCGTGSPLAQSGAQSCTAVFANGQFLLFDAGDNTLSALRAAKLPIGDLDAVFVTHFHNDHYADLGEVMEWSWVSGRRHVLPVHGPTGITQIVDGFQAAYELERGYRTAHHGPELMPPEWAAATAVEFEPPADDSALVVYKHDDVTVQAFRVDHDPIRPAAGYRIEAFGKVIVISGDTVRTESLLEQSRDADLLVSEVMNKEVVELMREVYDEIGSAANARILHDIQGYHMDVGEVGALAQEANVPRLALTHLAPKPQGRHQAKAFFRDPVEEAYDGELFVGEDGMRIVVPLS